MRRADALKQNMGFCDRVYKTHTKGAVDSNIYLRGARLETGFLLFPNEQNPVPKARGFVHQPLFFETVSDFPKEENFFAWRRCFLLLRLLETIECTQCEEDNESNDGEINHRLNEFSVLK